MDYAALGYRDCSSKSWAIQLEEIKNAVIILGAECREII